MQGGKVYSDQIIDADSFEPTSPEEIIFSEIASTSEIMELDVPEELGQTACHKVEHLTIREQFALSLKLTKREKEVAFLLFEGRNNPYIRGSLNISNNTLKTHLKNIYRKAMTTDRQQLLDLLNQFELQKRNETT